MDNRFFPKIEYWNNAFRVFLDLPEQDKTAFSIGTITPEKIFSLTLQFIDDQALKKPDLGIPTFEDFKNYFVRKPTPPTPPSRTEINQKADQEYFGYEPDRELWKECRLEFEMSEYHKHMGIFECAKKDYSNFCRLNTKDEKGYLQYLKNAYPPIKKFLKSALQMTIQAKDRLKHTYITGSTEAGKSELIKQYIYPYITEKDPSSAVVIIDPNGDMALEIAQFKECYQNDRLVYFDPYLSPEKHPVINPFFMGEYQNKPEYLDKTTQALVNVFEEMIEGIGGAGLTNQMNALLFPCLYFLLKKGNQSLADLQTMMKADRNSPLYQEAQNIDVEMHRNFFKTSFIDKPYNTTKHGIYTKNLSLLNSPVFYSCLTGQSTIDLETCLKQKKIIIFNLSKGRMGESSAQALGRFIIARILAFALNQAEIPIDQRATVHLVIDECQNYISSFIDQILTEARKYQLYLTLAQQVYGQEMKTTLRNKVVSCTALKFTGMNSLDTLSPMSKETGAKIAELEALDIGVFHCKVGKHRIRKPSLPVEIPTHLLGGKNAMSAEQWKETVQGQIERYYRTKEAFGAEQKQGKQSIFKDGEKIDCEELDFGYNKTPEPKENIAPESEENIDFGY